MNRKYGICFHIDPASHMRWTLLKFCALYDVKSYERVLAGALRCNERFKKRPCSRKSWCLVLLVPLLIFKKYPELRGENDKSDKNEDLFKKASLKLQNKQCSCIYPYAFSNVLHTNCRCPIKKQKSKYLTSD